MRKQNLKNEIKQLLLDVRNGALITPKLEYLLKIIGCPKCFGKGYGTKTEFASGSDDWSGKEYRWKLPEIEFCDCERGRQLEEILKKVDEVLRKKIK